MPYKDDVAFDRWLGIAKMNIEDLKTGENQFRLWKQLIFYIQGDERFKGDLKKSIFLYGNTGSGKSKTLEIMSLFINIDEIEYKRNHKQITFNYRTVTAQQIASDFAQNGYDGIINYKSVGNLCIDDLGAEAITTNHFGNKVNVLAEVIESRYARHLFTHFTSNLDEKEIIERYNDRVHSRIVHSCNMIAMNDKDFRIYKDEEKF
jgi:DNA replication protein DnaC